MTIRNQIAGLSLLLAFVGGISLVFAEDHWSDDWKVSVNGKADSGGVISFKLTFEPEGEDARRDPVTVMAPIPDNTKENDIADMMGNAFRAILGDDDFKVDVSWGENVKVKTRGDTPDFLLEITDNSVQGISLKLKD